MIGTARDWRRRVGGVRDYLPRLRRSWRIFLRIFSYLCLRIFFFRFLITLLMHHAPSGGLDRNDAQE